MPIICTKSTSSPNAVITCIRLSTFMRRRNCTRTFGSMTWASWTSSLRTLPNGCRRKAMVSPLPNSSTTSWNRVIAWGWNLPGNYPSSSSSSKSADLTGINRGLSSFTTGTTHTLGRLPRSFGLPSTGAPRWRLVGQNEARPPMLDLQTSSTETLAHWLFACPKVQFATPLSGFVPEWAWPLPKKGRGSWCFLALNKTRAKKPSTSNTKTICVLVWWIDFVALIEHCYDFLESRSSCNPCS
jgi:hypothetical protein